MRYFIHDLESNKLHIHTAGKADWQSLPEAERDAIKRTCLWSSSRGCWVSRTMATNSSYLRDILARNGFEDRGQDGEKIPFAERVQARQERAEDRADRFASRILEAKAEASGRFNSINVQAVRDLAGEPVKVGHHSERRHRALLDRADNDMRKGCEAMDRAEHYQRRAEAARQTAEGGHYSDPAFLARRIREQEAEERLLGRRIEEAGLKNNSEWLDRLHGLLDEVQDKLGFYRHCLEACIQKGATIYDRASLKDKKEVLIGGRWEPIVKLNPTTVAVPGVGYTEEIARKYPLKYPYTDVRDAR